MEVGLDAGIDGATQPTTYIWDSEEIWLDEGPLCGIHGATQTTTYIVDTDEIWLDDGPRCSIHGWISVAEVDEIYLDEGPKCCIHGWTSVADVDEIYLDEGPKCCIHGCDLRWKLSWHYDCMNLMVLQEYPKSEHQISRSCNYTKGNPWFEC